MALTHFGGHGVIGITAPMGQGAQPTDRVSRMLEAAGVVEKKVRSNPKSAVPGKQMAERAAKKAARAAAPAEA